MHKVFLNNGNQLQDNCHRESKLRFEPAGTSLFVVQQCRLTEKITWRVKWHGK